MTLMEVTVTPPQVTEVPLPTTCSSLIVNTLGPSFRGSTTTETTPFVGEPEMDSRNKMTAKQFFLSLKRKNSSICAMQNLPLSLRINTQD